MIIQLHLNLKLNNKLSHNALFMFLLKFNWLSIQVRLIYIINKKLLCPDYLINLQVGYYLIEKINIMLRNIKVV